MTPLLLLLTLGLGASGRDPPGVAEPASALEARLSSGSGFRPHGAVESLVGIAAGRAQRRAGPCGKACPDAPVLRGHCLCPTAAAPRRGPRPHGHWREGLSTPMEPQGPGTHGGTHGPPPHGEPPHGEPPHGDGRPDALPHSRAQSPPWGTDTPTRDTPTRDTPTALHPPTATRPADTDPTATGPTATGPGPTATEQLSIVERLVLGSAAGLGLALCPLLALALLRCPLGPRCPRAARACLHALPPALAAGALSGDALLHLLPEFLGLHTHGGEAHADGAHGHAGEAAEARWKLLAVLGGLFAAFVLEKLLGLLLPPGREGDPQRDQPVEVGQQAGSTADLAKVEVADPNVGRAEPPSPGGRALPWVLTLAAGAHSLVDGLALGAAFGASWQSGVATALALLCHELPHALGDVSVLAQAGLSGRRVLVRGLGGALPLLPGLYAGLGLGSAAAPRAWLAALATGLLLYLALCHMVPAMLAARPGRPWLQLGVQSAGLLGGWGLLLLLALYEGGGPH